MSDVPPFIPPGEIKCEWSRSLAKTASKAFFVRKYRNSLLLLVLGFLLGGCFLIGFYVGMVQGEKLAWVYVIPMFVWLLCLIPVLLSYVRNSNQFSNLVGKSFVILFNENGIKILSNGRALEIGWQEITTVWVSGKFWFVIYGTNKRVFSLYVVDSSLDILEIFESKAQHANFSRRM